MVVVHLDGAGRDRQVPARGHRVARVDREVDQYLFDLAGIGDHQRQLVGQLGVQRDVLADRAAQHLLHVADDPVEIEHPGPDHLAAGEREQLVGELGTAPRGPDDLLGVPADRRHVRRRRLGLLDDERAVVEDHREQVVEVVRHSPGELAQALQPLGTVHPRLQPLALRLGPQPLLLGLRVPPLGDVADHQAAHRAVLGVQAADGHLDREGTAVLAPGETGQLAARGDHHAAAPHLPDVLGQALGDQVPDRPPGQLVLGVPEQPLGLLVGQHDVAGLVDADDRVRRRLQYRLEPGLGPLPLAEVAGGLRDADDPAGRVGQRGHRQRHADDRAVAADPAGAEPLQPRALRHQRDDLAFVVAPVVRDDQLGGPADGLLGGVPVEDLRAVVPAEDPAVQRGAHDRVVRGGHDRREQRLGLVALAAGAQVVQDDDGTGVGAAHAGLGGQVAAVGPARDHLAGALRQVAADHRPDRLAGQRVRRVPEQLGGRLVGQPDVPARADDDDRLGYRVQHRARLQLIQIHANPRKRTIIMT